MTNEEKLVVQMMVSDAINQIAGAIDGVKDAILFNTIARKNPETGKVIFDEQDEARFEKVSKFIESLEFMPDNSENIPGIQDDENLEQGENNV